MEVFQSDIRHSRNMGKYDTFQPYVTSILTLSKYDPSILCRTSRSLTNAIYRYSLPFVVFDIHGGQISAAHARAMAAETPECMPVKKIKYFGLWSSFNNLFRSNRMTQKANIQGREYFYVKM